MLPNLRDFTLSDHFICGIDKCIRTILPSSNTSSTTYPGDGINEARLSEKEKKKIAGLMRINHSGEICAQALYLGQSMTARDTSIRDALKEAAEEETAHLTWCAQRLKELDNRTSFLNPLWFIGSLSIGVFAGLAGDRVSLGFLHETENQVVRHLSAHLKKLPFEDLRTKAILEQMKIDEAQHASLALQQGAISFPNWVKRSMQLTSKVMTTITYYV